MSHCGWFELLAEEFVVCIHVEELLSIGGTYGNLEYYRKKNHMNFPDLYPKLSSEELKEPN